MKLAKTQSDTVVNLKEKTSTKGLSNINKYGYLFIPPFLVVFLMVLVVIVKIKKQLGIL